MERFRHLVKKNGYPVEINPEKENWHCPVCGKELCCDYLVKRLKHLYQKE